LQREIDAILPIVGMDKLRWEKPVLEFETPGVEVDFGGIGKEYAADRMASLLLAEGVEHGLVNLGGDIVAMGPHPDGSAWRISLRHPREPEVNLGEIRLTHGSIATSGDYERCIVVDGRRYCHILDPLTGWPTSGLASVTVLSRQCMVAGSVTTIAMLKGARGKEWLASMGLPYLWVDDEGQTGGDLLMNHSELPEIPDC